jgi:hypothetical protein
MTDRFKKPKAKVADAAAALFAARLEAIDVILADANPLEVLMVCAHALAQVAPGCCETHLAEFEADLLAHLRECVAQQQEAEDAAETDEGAEVPPRVH